MLLISQNNSTMGIRVTLIDNEALEFVFYILSVLFIFTTDFESMRIDSI